MNKIQSILFQKELKALLEKYSVEIKFKYADKQYISDDAIVIRDQKTRSDLLKFNGTKLTSYDLLKNISINDAITYRRPPTPWEIKFGEGATHYKDFSVDHCLKRNGDLKKWVKCPYDGLRYYR